MRVGISGHQDLGSFEQRLWVESSIRIWLNANILSVGITSLAIGADQLFAKLVLEARHKLEVIIPCSGYELTFSNENDRVEFRRLKGSAVECHMLDYNICSEEAFYRAGQTIVEISDVMLFVWNGKPAKGFGGTADIVKYAKQVHRQYTHINLSELTVTNH